MFIDMFIIINIVIDAAIARGVFTTIPFSSCEFPFRVSEMSACFS